MKSFVRPLSIFLTLATILVLTAVLSSCGEIGDISATIESSLEKIEDISGAVESSQEEAQKKIYHRGNVEGETYTSTFMGIRYTKPADWLFLTDEEIVATMETAREILSDEDFATSMNSTQFEFFAQNTTGDSVAMEVVRVSSDVDVMQTVTESSDYFKSTYESLGYTTVCDNPTIKTVAGKEFTTLTVTVTIDNTVMSQFIYVCKVEDYIYSLSFTTVSGISQSEFEAMLSLAE